MTMVLCLACGHEHHINDFCVSYAEPTPKPVSVGLRALSAVPDDGLGSSLRDTHRDAAPPIVGLFQHVEDDERWMIEAFGLAEFEKLSTDGHADLADDLQRDADARDKAGEPGTGSRIRAAANFIRAAVALRSRFPATPAGSE